MAKFLNNYSASNDKSATGVMLVNLGTPESAEIPQVRRFLRQFLSDRRLIELTRLIWWLILNGIILVVRPSKSAAAYGQVWTEEGSPLMLHSTKLAQALQTELGNADSVRVSLAMRYGFPSVAQAMDDLTGGGADRIVVLPLYPQYSATTVASVFDELGDVLKKRRFVPSLRFVSGYAAHESYIECLAESVLAHWRENGRSQCLMMSFHGIPQDYSDNGDPYREQCLVTASELARRLELTDDRWTLAFQSRFGPKQWLQPYTSDVLSDLVAQGVTTLDVICPGFSVDCLETLEEVNIGYREEFLRAGGESFQYVSCLNDTPRHAKMAADIVRETASDWFTDQGRPSD